MVRALALACTLSGENADLVRETLNGWTVLETTVFAPAAATAPEIILFDRRCQHTLRVDARGAYRLGHRRMRVTGREHRGTLQLPGGRQMPAAAAAFTSLGDSGHVFFVAALPDVWRADKRYRGDSTPWRQFLPVVLIHELTHTRQLAAIVTAIRPALASAQLSTLDDDIIQARYGRDSAFSASVGRERDGLLAAASDTNTCTADSLIRDVLARRARRHATYFSGADSGYAVLETRFLDMEGVGQWAALQFALRTRQTGETIDGVLSRVRDNKRWWSQEYGLALYLVLDARVPGWPRRVFPPALTTAIELLSERVTGAPTCAKPAPDTQSWTAVPRQHDLRAAPLSRRPSNH
jgi:hypothetical protein